MDLLPVGSVVLLEEGMRKTVIMGIMQFNEAEPDKVYDYLGVPYPVGYVGKESRYLFNRDAIQKVLFRGYEDEAGDELFRRIGDLLEEADWTDFKER